MRKAISPKDSLLVERLERPRKSRLISEMRERRRRQTAAWDPGRKMEAAYLLSVEARKVLIAGLQSQGFTPSEIEAILRTRRK